MALSGLDTKAKRGKLSPMNMTKAQLRERLGLTDSQLADLFGITRSAVCQWPDDEPIPQPRQWQLQVLRPELFKRKQAA